MKSRYFRVILLSLLFLFIECSYVAYDKSFLPGIFHSIDLKYLQMNNKPYSGDRWSLSRARVVLKNKKEKKKAIYTLGCSFGREFMPAESRFRNDFKLPFYVLNTPDQSPYDTIRFLEYIERGSTVFYTIFPVRMMKALEKELYYHKFLLGYDSLIGLPSREVDRLLAGITIETDRKARFFANNIFFLRAFKNVIRKKVDFFPNLLNRSMSIEQYFVDSRPLLQHRTIKSSEEYKREVLEKYKGWVEDYSLCLEKSIELIVEAYRVAKRRGINFYILDLPSSPRLRTTLEKEYREYRLVLEKMLEVHNVPYIRPERIHGKANDSYYNDAVHLNGMGRDAFYRDIKEVVGEYAK